jgi:diguanylate cyclase (GGDEF)-like protein
MFDKYKLLIIITILLSLGFFITSFFSYKIAVDLTKNELKYKSLPLSSDNIYSEIQRDLLKPNLISSLMAQDTFMINWILNGEKDVDKISSYLGTIQKKYNTSSSFLVSDKTRNYYYPKGILKQIDPKEKRDEWFYRVKNIVDKYESNIDIDLAQDDSMTIFTNYRVNNKEGEFIAAVGVGLKTEQVSKLLKNYKKKYNHDIYFINKKNKILLSSKDISTINKEHKELMTKIITHFNKEDTTSHEYKKEDGTYLLNVRFIDELNLYLCVEVKENFITGKLKKTFYLNILMFTIIIIIIILLIIYYINNNHNTLHKFANTDKLTSLNNRNNFDKAFQSIFISNKEDLTLLLFDIDNFKNINDEFGHLVGDKVLRRVASLFKSTFREHDLIARWGGDEFIALLSNVNNISAYKLSDRLRMRIKQDEILRDLLSKPLTISTGIVTKSNEKNIEELFVKVDKNLYQAKQEGRNKIVY